jgi:hypothetical protein
MSSKVAKSAKEKKIAPKKDSTTRIFSTTHPRNTSPVQSKPKAQQSDQEGTINKFALHNKAPFAVAASLTRSRRNKTKQVLYCITKPLCIAVSEKPAQRMNRDPSGVGRGRASQQKRNPPPPVERPMKGKMLWKPSR